MNQGLALRTLSLIMKWPDDRSRAEFAWLRLMARMKYDDYRDFLAGVRFVESLAKWLQQFDAAERETAYHFIRNQLVYIGAAEMQRLVESFYAGTVQRHLLQRVAKQLGIPKYRVWSHPQGQATFERLRRKTLFMGLSDGARIDILRHTNVGVISNEQAALTTQLDSDKWKDLLKKLRKDLDQEDARFAAVYLIDDFMGTGTSFLRFNQDTQEWTGKLARFRDSAQRAIRDLGADRPFEEDWELCAHHYLASHKAAGDARARTQEAAHLLRAALSFSSIHLSFGLILPESLPIDATASRNADMIALTHKYYDPILRTEHTDVGGVTHLGLGYGGCALPLVLEHNTPNNSVALLWAETDGGDREGHTAPAMRPLFRRRQRHS